MTEDTADQATSSGNDTAEPGEATPSLFSLALWGPDGPPDNVTGRHGWGFPCIGDDAPGARVDEETGGLIPWGQSVSPLRRPVAIPPPHMLISPFPPSAPAPAASRRRRPHGTPWPPCAPRRPWSATSASFASTGRRSEHSTPRFAKTPKTHRPQGSRAGHALACLNTKLGSFRGLSNLGERVQCRACGRAARPSSAVGRCRSAG